MVIGPTVAILITHSCPVAIRVARALTPGEVAVAGLVANIVVGEPAAVPLRVVDFENGVADKHPVALCRQTIRHNAHDLQAASDRIHVEAKRDTASLWLCMPASSDASARSGHMLCPRNRLRLNLRHRGALPFGRIDGRAPTTLPTPSPTTLPQRSAKPRKTFRIVPIMRSESGSNL